MLFLSFLCGVLALDLNFDWGGAPSQVNCTKQLHHLLDGTDKFGSRTAHDWVLHRRPNRGDALGCVSAHCHRGAVWVSDLQAGEAAVPA